MERGHPIDNGIGESAAEEFTAHEASEESNKYEAFDYGEPSCGETAASDFVGDDGSDGACEACVDGCRDEEEGVVLVGFPDGDEAEEGASAKAEGEGEDDTKGDGTENGMVQDAAVFVALFMGFGGEGEEDC